MSQGDITNVHGSQSGQLDRHQLESPNNFKRSLKYQNPIILNYTEPNVIEYDLRKFYQSFFYIVVNQHLCRMYKNSIIDKIHSFVMNKCSYINKYGAKCNNNCTSRSPFVIRDYFCENHIKNNINDIIKFNTFICGFVYIQTIINNLLFTVNNIERGYTSLKFNLRKFVKKMFHFIQENIDYLLLSPVFVNITHDMIFNCFSQNIYELNEYKIHVNFLKKFSFENIVNTNKKYRKDVIDTLINLTNNSNNYIGKVFMNSNIGDLNIFKIIEKYI